MSVHDCEYKMALKGASLLLQAQGKSTLVSAHASSSVPESYIYGGQHRCFSALSSPVL